MKQILGNQWKEKYQFSGTPTEKQVVVKLKQNVYQEKDSSKNCRNYPNERYKSYGACDDDFLKNHIPPNIYPIWLEDNLNEVTVITAIQRIENSSVDLGDLPDGTQLSDCPLPCTTTFVETRLISETSSLNNISILNLTFSPTMTVITTRFVRFVLAKEKLQRLNSWWQQLEISSFQICILSKNNYG